MKTNSAFRKVEEKNKRGGGGKEAVSSEVRQFPAKRWYLLTSLSLLDEGNGPLLTPHREHLSSASTLRKMRDPP